MAAHSHITTPTPIARRRGARPASSVLDRRLPEALGLRPPTSSRDTIIHIRLPATLEGSFGRIARVQLEHHVTRIIAILDAWDGDVEGEENHEGCCAAGDDDAGSILPFGLGCDHNPGEPDDAEPWLGWTLDGNLGCSADDDRENDKADSEPSDGNDFGGDRLTCVSGGVPA